MRKNNNPVLLIILMIVGGLLFYFNFSKPNDKKLPKKEIISTQSPSYVTVANETIVEQFNFDGIVCLPEHEWVISTQDGSIEYFNSDTFRKGDVIIRFNNEKLFQILSNKKEAFKSSLTQYKLTLNDSLSVKWENYISTISPKKILVALPSPLSDLELSNLKKLNAIKLYNELVDLEAEMENYFITTPITGFLTPYTNSDLSNVKTGDTLFEIKQDVPILIKALLADELLEKVKSNKKITSINANQHKIGTPKLFFQKKIKSRKYLTYLSLTDKEGFHLKNGETITTTCFNESEQSFFKIPLSYITADIKVKTKGNAYKKANIIKSDSLYHYVTGLKDGEIIFDPNE